MNPNREIIRQVKDRTFNLSTHPVFRNNPQRLMDIGWQKSKELFERRVGGEASPERLFNLYRLYFSKIEMIEHEIKSQLEKIAEDTIRELYEVPHQIKLLPKIVEQSEIEYDIESQREDLKLENTILPDRLIKIQEEVNKRIILNSIVNGSSVMIWSHAYYISKEKLDELNSNLIQYYDIYSSVVGMLLWLSPPVFNQETIESQGICQVDFEEGNQSMGINFPVLLMETNKVVMDYLICRAIPKDFSEDELKLYYAMSDSYEQEFWHNLLSPVLYSDLLETLDVDSQSLPTIIAKLCEIKYEKLEEIFIAIQNDKTQAKLIFKNLL